MSFMKVYPLMQSPSKERPETIDFLRIFKIGCKGSDKNFLNKLKTLSYGFKTDSLTFEIL